MEEYDSHSETEEMDASPGGSPEEQQCEYGDEEEISRLSAPIMILRVAGAPEHLLQPLVDYFNEDMTRRTKIPSPKLLHRMVAVLNGYDGTDRWPVDQAPAKINLLSRKAKDKTLDVTHGVPVKTVVEAAASEGLVMNIPGRTIASPNERFRMAFAAGGRLSEVNSPPSMRWKFEDKRANLDIELRLVIAALRTSSIDVKQVNDLIQLDKKLGTSFKRYHNNLGKFASNISILYPPTGTDASKKVHSMLFTSKVTSEVIKALTTEYFSNDSFSGAIGKFFKFSQSQSYLEAIQEFEERADAMEKSVLQPILAALRAIRLKDEDGTKMDFLYQGPRFMEIMRKQLLPLHANGMWGAEPVEDALLVGVGDSNIQYVEGVHGHKLDIKSNADVPGMIEADFLKDEPTAEYKVVFSDARTSAAASDAYFRAVHGTSLSTEAGPGAARTKQKEQLYGTPLDQTYCFLHRALKQEIPDVTAKLILDRGSRNYKEFTELGKSHLLDFSCGGRGHNMEVFVRARSREKFSELSEKRGPIPPSVVDKVVTQYEQWALKVSLDRLRTEMRGEYVFRKISDMPHVARSIIELGNKKIHIRRPPDLTNVRLVSPKVAPVAASVEVPSGEGAPEDDFEFEVSEDEPFPAEDENEY